MEKDKSKNRFVLIDVENPFQFRNPKPKKKEEKKDALKKAASDDKNKK